MAGIAGNRAFWGFAKQTAYNTPAATAVFRTPYSGGAIQPAREIGRLAETDGSRDRGRAYVQQHSVQGTPEMYVRYDNIGLLLLAGMGAVVTTGAGADKSHAFSMAALIPYMTLFSGVGDQVFEKFSDVFVSSLAFRAEAGQPMTVAAGVRGRKTTFSDADASGSAAIADSMPFNYNQVAVEFDGGATSKVSSFDLSLENNVNVQQTDDVTIEDVVAGTREGSLGFDMIFENDDMLRKFHTGSASGTAITDQIYTTTAKFTFTISATREIVFDFPSVAIEEYPVEPDTGGDPIVVPVRTSLEPIEGASLFTVTLKNQVTSY